MKAMTSRKMSPGRFRRISSMMRRGMRMVRRAWRVTIKSINTMDAGFLAKPNAKRYSLLSSTRRNFGLPEFLPGFTEHLDHLFVCRLKGGQAAFGNQPSNAGQISLCRVRARTLHGSHFSRPSLVAKYITAEKLGQRNEMRRCTRNAKCGMENGE